MAPRKHKKPEWIVEKERAKRGDAAESLWLFGIHAVRDALMNPKREKLRLMVTKNAADRLEEAITASGMEPEVVDPRNFNPPIDAQSVHQGAVLEVKPLNWGSVSELCAPQDEAPLLVLLDRVSDPHNVGAILRSAEVFGARAVIAPHRHSAPETGALAKTASGALERQPNVPIALALGSEGPGLRELTKKTCHRVAKIPFAGEFGSLNVSNAGAVSLYAASSWKQAFST